MVHGSGTVKTGATIDDVRDTLTRDLRLIGETPVFQKVIEQCICVAPHDFTVLLAGETGTGKELVARAIHYLSGRRAGPFVPVDCAAIPESLMAHELFGHVRGAFTDAREYSVGILASAMGGTLFLDEVESLSLGAQGALLRLLDRREWRPLGSQQWKSLDARIIAATNEDLRELIDRGSFRKDLYFRLASEICRLPPLRERREDIPHLAQNYLSRLCKRFGKPWKLSSEALDRLINYSWPGNVRELQHCLQRSALRNGGLTIRPSDLVFSNSSYEDIEGSDCTSMTVSWKEARLRAIASWEKQYLREILGRQSGNLSRVARQLSISRMQLYRLIRRHSLPSQI